MDFLKYGSDEEDANLRTSDSKDIDETTPDNPEDYNDETENSEKSEEVWDSDKPGIDEDEDKSSDSSVEELEDNDPFDSEQENSNSSEFDIKRKIDKSTEDDISDRNVQTEHSEDDEEDYDSNISGVDYEPRNSYAKVEVDMKLPPKMIFTRELRYENRFPISLKALYGGEHSYLPSASKALIELVGPAPVNVSASYGGGTDLKHRRDRNCLKHLKIGGTWNAQKQFYLVQPTI